MCARPCTCRCSPGSDRVLRAMRRSYRSERFLSILDKVRTAIPHAAITTDLIVGFPGETERGLPGHARRGGRRPVQRSAFTFQYSKRPGTPAAELDGQLSKAVVQERYQRLIELQERISLEENTAQIGRTVELLVAVGEGRKDARTARMSGRARDGRLVHFTPMGADIRPGDIVTTTVTDAAPHHLIADGTVLHHRRTRAGDAHAGGQRPAGCGPWHARYRRAREPADRDRMCPVTAGDNQNGDFEEFKGDIEAAERRVAREIDPGARALVIAIGVFVLLLTFVLPHTGGARGWDVLAGNDAAIGEGMSLPSRVFTWLALVFSVGFSMLALLTRRWALAWIALAGSTVASFWACWRCGHGRPPPNRTRDPASG